MGRGFFLGRRRFIVGKWGVFLGGGGVARFFVVF